MLYRGDSCIQSYSTKSQPVFALGSSFGEPQVGVGTSCLLVQVIHEAGRFLLALLREVRASTIKILALDVCGAGAFRPVERFLPGTFPRAAQFTNSRL
jgi:hypothetical protein